MMEFKRVKYLDLKARQKENYNFQKLAGILADYGFNCMRLSDDWLGADFLAVHVDGETILKVQLKARVGFYKKYIGKNIWMACPDGDDAWYVFPHDDMLEEALKLKVIPEMTLTWEEQKDGYIFGKSAPQDVKKLLKEFKL